MLTNKNLAAKIHKIFPNLQWKKTKSITSGWDHDILLLDDKFVVRVPKNIEAKKRALVDFSLLKQLRNKITADTPTPVAKDDKSRIAIYKMVNGIIMSENKYKKLSQIQKDKFAKNIALFLSQFHSIPTSIALKCGIKKQSNSIKNKEIARDIKIIYPKLRAKQRIAIDVFIKRQKEILKDFNQILIHGDLTDENIFINKNKLGIIDFSDAIIDDPARDFSALFSYGDKFVQKVIKQYKLDPDRNIYERAEVYYQEMAITLMALAIEGSELINLEDAKKLFNKRLNIKRV